MFLVQIIKFSAGWFLFTTDITNFPFWAIICFSAVHTLVYIVHKSGIDISKAIKNIWFLIFFALINILFFLSIALYPFRMSLVLSFASLTVPIIVLQSDMRRERKLFLDYTLMQVIMVIFVTTAIIGL
jgi:hypothetical protein